MWYKKDELFIFFIIVVQMTLVPVTRQPQCAVSPFWYLLVLLVLLVVINVYLALRSSVTPALHLPLPHHLL